MIVSSRPTLGVSKSEWSPGCMSLFLKGTLQLLAPPRTAGGCPGAPGSGEEAESHTVTLLSLSSSQDSRAESLRVFSLPYFTFINTRDVPHPRQAKLKTAGAGVRSASPHLRTSKCTHFVWSSNNCLRPWPLFTKCVTEGALSLGARTAASPPHILTTEVQAVFQS